MLVAYMGRQAQKASPSHGDIVAKRPLPRIAIFSGGSAYVPPPPPVGTNGSIEPYLNTVRLYVI